MTEIKRKGARSIREIPAEVLLQLNSGEIETVNLMEWLAVDQLALLQAVLAQTARSHYLPRIQSQVDGLAKRTVNSVNEAIGSSLFTQSEDANDREIFEALATHSSDSVRCWASYFVARNHNITLSRKFEAIRRFAADLHFGVREISWLVIRPAIAKNLEESLGILSGWTSSQDENVRRFASEATRPRGVWCEHLNPLKTDPELGLKILEPLKSDPARYVQDSVANWLNDASKSRPDFVLQLCSKWSEDSPTKETAYIVKKALRSLNKSEATTT